MKIKYINTNMRINATDLNFSASLFISPFDLNIYVHTYINFNKVFIPYKRRKKNVVPQGT